MKDIDIQRHNGKVTSALAVTPDPVEGAAGSSRSLLAVCEAIQFQRRQIESLLRTQAHLIAALGKTLEGLLDDSGAAESSEALERARQEIAQLERLYGAGGEAQA